MAQASYVQRRTTKVTRVEHVVRVWMGAEALDLKGAAAKVPNVAKLIDIEESENGDRLLVFVEERAEKGKQ